MCADARSREPEDIIKEDRRALWLTVLWSDASRTERQLLRKESGTSDHLCGALKKSREDRRTGAHPLHDFPTKDLSDELIETMRDSKKICSHLHLPLQSGSSEILKRMNRKYSKEQYLALVEKLRAAIPDISPDYGYHRGIPGETEEDFEETMDVVRKVRYDSAFTFIYSSAPELRRRPCRTRFRRMS